jgi:hypothetical protein
MRYVFSRSILPRMGPLSLFGCSWSVQFPFSFEAAHGREYSRRTASGINTMYPVDMRLLKWLRY